MKRILYIVGEENDEFNQLEQELKEHGETVDSGWRGDFFVITYKLGGKLYEHWTDWEYGIPHSIEEVEQ